LHFVIYLHRPTICNLSPLHCAPLCCTLHLHCIALCVECPSYSLQFSIMLYLPPTSNTLFCYVVLHFVFQFLSIFCVFPSCLVHHLVHCPSHNKGQPSSLTCEVCFLAMSYFNFVCACPLFLHRVFCLSKVDVVFVIFIMCW
jgi:hypothetical protein